MSVTATSNAIRHGTSSFRFAPSTDFSSATILFLTSLLSGFIYWEVGYDFVAQKVHPQFSDVIASLLLVSTVFTLGCVVHLKLIGGKSLQRFRKEMQKEISAILGMLHYCNRNIERYDAALGGNRYAMPPRGTESLVRARKLVNAIEDRMREVGTLMATQKNADMMDAFELLHRKLSTNENCLETLIDAAPIENLDPSEWAPTLEQLFAEIELALRKRA